MTMKTFVTVFMLLLLNQASSKSSSSFSSSSTPEQQATGTTNNYWATDQNYNYYNIGSDNLQKCFVEKFSKGKSLWKVVYDQSGRQCIESMIEANGNDIYAVFRVQGFAPDNKDFISNKVDTTAKKAFSKGLWNKITDTNDLLDVLVKINPLNGKLLAGTFLISKHASGQSYEEATYPLTVKGIQISEEGIWMTVYSFAYPPKPLQPQNEFYSYVDKDNVRLWIEVDFNLQTVIDATLREPRRLFMTNSQVIQTISILLLLAMAV